MIYLFLRNFFKVESASGIVLFFSALVAIALDNSPWAPAYQAIFNTGFTFSAWSHPFFIKSLLYWVNEGLMALFFLVVGLELKREFVEGELARFSKIVLPGVAAIGGMFIPALIFMLWNGTHADTVKGWTIPVATDIAFALGVLSLFGKRVPIGLTLFLMSLAIFDDLGAIIIIALTHSEGLSWGAVGLAGLVGLGLYCLNRLHVARILPYVVLGLLLWLFVLLSGVHATLAGVILALLIPVGTGRRLENMLHPWVAFIILPLFALGNAGISFQGLTLATLTDSLTLGIISGLVFGKQLGVMFFTFMVIKLGWAALPRGTSWWQFYGVSWLCGIGFTMSLFLGTLAFEHNNPLYLSKVRLGVLLGSSLSGLIGAVILYFTFRGKKLRRSKVATP